MTKTITQRELRNDNAEVLRAVAAGEDFVVTRNGTPVAQVSPVQPSPFVAVSRLTQSAEHLPRIDSARFFADIDSAVDQEIDA